MSAPEAAPPQGSADASPATADASATTSAALREDQIQNAIAFLTHPKVRDSGVATKRSFLERKGLTEAEIDEAFKRVPSGVASSTSLTPTGLITYQNPSSPPAPQTAAAPQQAAYPHAPAGAPGGYQTALVPVQQGPVVTAPPQPEPIRWTQVLLGVGVVAASVYALKAMLLPYAQEWYSAWSERSRAQKEAQERQVLVMQEAADALKACQAELKNSSESMATFVTSLKAEQQRQYDATRAAEHTASRQNEQLLRELSDIKQSLNAPQPQRGQQPGTLGSMFGEDRLYKPPASSTGHYNSHHNGRQDYRSPARQSAYDPPSYSNGWRQHPQAEEESPVYPGGSRTLAPPPGGYLGGPGAQPERTWAAPVAAGARPPGGDAAGQGAGAGGERAAAPGAAGEYPPSFHEVMEMVSKGITPPNVRTDINDAPPDPTRPLPRASVTPQPKPWEHASGTAYGSANSSSSAPTHQPTYSAPATPSPLPPWQQNQYQSSATPLAAGGYASSGLGPQANGRGAAQVPDSAVGTTLLPEQQQFGAPPDAHYGAATAPSGSGAAPSPAPAGDAWRGVGMQAGPSPASTGEAWGSGGAGVGASSPGDATAGAPGAASQAQDAGYGGYPQRPGAYSSVFAAGSGARGGAPVSASAHLAAQTPAPPPVSVLQPNAAWRPPPPPQSQLPQSRAQSATVAPVAAAPAPPSPVVQPLGPEEGRGDSQAAPRAASAPADMTADSTELLGVGPQEQGQQQPGGVEVAELAS